MATSLRPYLNSVRAAVTSAMCIRNLPCQLVRAAAAAVSAALPSAWRARASKRASERPSPPLRRR
jgi:hypothetical protein